MKRTELNEQERKALIALADHAAGMLPTDWWQQEHGATQSIRRRLQRLGLVEFSRPQWCWCITSAGQRRAAEERNR